MLSTWTHADRERTATRSFRASWLCKVPWRYSSYAPSSRSSHSLRLSPPAYPLSDPSAATTRWHGTIIEMGLRATAAPTARGDTAGASFPGTRCRAAIRWAISPYVATSPRGIESSSNQTSRWNAVPIICNGGVNRGSCPAKLAFSQAQERSSTEEAAPFAGLTDDMPPIPETASAPSTCSESSRRSVEPKCSCPSNQSPVRPRPSAASKISPKGEANVVVTTSGSFQNSANIIPRTVQTTSADTSGRARNYFSEAVFPNQAKKTRGFDARAVPPPAEL